MIRVAGLYGLGRNEIKIPVSRTESVDSGPIVMTLDPESESSGNLGVLDFQEHSLRMRNGIQLVFGGLHDVVKGEEYDRALLNPPRGLAVTEATINPGYCGWEARTCVDFLPGSMWSGSGGG
jgi:hypothetical protein